MLVLVSSRVVVGEPSWLLSVTARCTSLLTGLENSRDLSPHPSPPDMLSTYPATAAGVGPVSWRIRDERASTRRNGLVNASTPDRGSTSYIGEVLSVTGLADG